MIGRAVAAASKGDVTTRATDPRRQPTSRYAATHSAICTEGKDSQRFMAGYAMSLLGLTRYLVPVARWPYTAISAGCKAWASEISFE
jgi:hypothetical protein